MRVAQLWRFPVKSLQGEQLQTAEIGPDGITGDRQWAIFDVETGFGLTARRAPELLFASARLRNDGRADITLPDGSIAAGDAALSTWLGRPVSLRSTAETVDPRYEGTGAFEDETTATWKPFNGANGAFHDAGRAKVSILSTATLGDWDPRRFRANLIVDGDGEDAFVGHRVKVGAALLDVGMNIVRCVMVTRPQRGGVDRDLEVLRTIHRTRQGRLAVGATVPRTGQVRVGDGVTPG